MTTKPDCIIAIALGKGSFGYKSFLSFDAGTKDCSAGLSRHSSCSDQHFHSSCNWVMPVSKVANRNQLGTQSSDYSLHIGISLLHRNPRGLASSVAC